jgi:hypothetical protein
MHTYLTCPHCGLPFEQPPGARAPVLRCPCCDGGVDNPRYFPRYWQVPVGSLAASVAVLVLLSPCWSFMLLLLLEMIGSSSLIAVPLGIGGGGLLLWGIARHTLDRLLPSEWATAASVALAVLLALAFLLVTVGMFCGLRR